MDAAIEKSLHKWAYGLQVQHPYQLPPYCDVVKVVVKKRLYCLLKEMAGEEVGSLGASFRCDKLLMANGVVVECSDEE